MMNLFGIPSQALLGQLLIGLINGSFYALLSLGLALVFGLLNIVNFAHGALFMLGAYVAYCLMTFIGLDFWGALLLAPLLVALFGALVERFLLRRIYGLDHSYGMLLTFGLTLVIEGGVRLGFGAAGVPYAIPEILQGGINLGFMFLPYYRAMVLVLSIVLCLLTWFVIERSKTGSYLRAAMQDPVLVQVLGVNVPLMIVLTYGAGVALAAVGGALAAPIYSVTPLMGANIITIVFAVIVIGGMGSIAGAIIAGFALGAIEGLTKAFYAEASTAVIYVIMLIVLLLSPHGLFGKEPPVHATADGRPPLLKFTIGTKPMFLVLLGVVLLGLAMPMFVYPAFLMKALCFALFASSFNLLMGYGGLLSFGHAAFFGIASYITAHTAKTWGLTPELAILAGTAVSIVLGGVFGWLSIRRKGIYFAMITLALSELVYFAAVRLPFTGGEDGIQGVPRGKFLGLIDLTSLNAMYYFVFGVFLIGMFVLYRAINSPFGEVLRGVRENEARAISLGYKVNRYKWLAFVLSAALAGLAGATKTFVFQFVSLGDVHWSSSAAVLLMTVLGGVGTLLGPVVGAFLILAMEQFLAPWGPWVVVIEGVTFIICVLTFRQGIVGVAQNAIARRLARARPSHVEKRAALASKP